MRNQVSCFVAISAAVVVVGCSEAAPSTPSYTTGTPTSGTTGAGGSAAAGSGSSSSSNTSSSSSGSAGSTTSSTTSSPTTSAGAGGAGGGSGTTETTSTTGGGGGGTAGTGGSTGTAGAGGSGGSGGSGTGGAGGGAPSGAITSVAPTTGCGKAAPANGRATIQTMGTKPAGCADSKCGAWSYEREYFINLPTNYNNMKAYPLVFLGPGCQSGGQAIYPLQSIYQNTSTNNVDQTVIRIGITPPPNTIGHATNPNQGCFDDKEGDDSVDWVLYEALWDKLAGQLCFDRNRVFASGNSSGAWFSNEVGCKYAGDPVHPIRGIMPNTGGLPNQPQFKPTCTTKGMAGMWVHEINDPTNPFSGNIYAIDRAMQVNGCTIGTNYGNAMFDPFPITPTNSSSCKKMRGCPELYPIVVCPLTGNGHGSHDDVANPGFATFIKLFSAGNLITQ